MDGGRRPGGPPAPQRGCQGRQSRWGFQTGTGSRRPGLYQRMDQVAPDPGRAGHLSPHLLVGGRPGSPPVLVEHQDLPRARRHRGGRDLAGRKHLRKRPGQVSGDGQRPALFFSRGLQMGYGADPVEGLFRGRKPPHAALHGHVQPRRRGHGAEGRVHGNLWNHQGSRGPFHQEIQGRRRGLFVPRAQECRRLLAGKRFLPHRFLEDGHQRGFHRDRRRGPLLRRQARYLGVRDLRPGPDGPLPVLRRRQRPGPRRRTRSRFYAVRPVGQARWHGCLLAGEHLPEGGLGLYGLSRQ
mmetsp:Transcript_19333/g.39678  ORF Transcript_19333/g.39678 Transcript_19333/m.39678 type:complete len:296 (+) Transcript_19333:397-1284(+)